MDLAVIPVLVGPLQALLAVLPALLLALAAAVAAMFRPSAVKRLARLLWSQKLIVAPAATAIVLLVHYWPVLFPPVNAAGLREGADASWALWRGGAARRGAALDEVDEPARGQVRWRFTHGSMQTFYSSPAVVGNRVYATGGEYAPPWTDRGGVFSLDADTGRPAWTFTAEGYRSTFSSPSVLGDYLVVGEGLHETRDARIFCFDIAASEAAGTGVTLWSLRTGSHVESSPCLVDGKAYIGAGDDGFYCLDLAGAGDGQPRVIWHVSGETYPDCETSAAAADGCVYFGLGEGGKAVVCLDAATGAERWRTPTPYPTFGSPALADGRVVVGMGLGNYMQSAEQIAAAMDAAMASEGVDAAARRRATEGMVPAGEVWCLDGKTGEPVWRFTEVERTVLGSPAIADGRVYFGSRDGKVYSVSLADGTLQAAYDTHGPIVSGLAVGRRYVYAVTQGGQLFGIDRRTFRPTWTANLDGPTCSSPAVARGSVYVGVGHVGCPGGLVRVGEPGEEKVAPLWAGLGGGPGESGWADRSAVPRKVRLAWRRRPGSADAPGVLTSPAASVGPAIYVGVRAGEQAGLARWNIPAAEGRVDEPTRTWLAPTAKAVTASPVVVDDRVLFVEGGVCDEGRRLRCVAAETGRELWTQPIGPRAGGQPVATARRVFVADAETSLSCYDLDGRRLWAAPVGRLTGAPLSVGDLLFVSAAGEDGTTLTALDGPTGQMLWRRATEAALTGGPVSAGERLWAPDEAGAAAFDPLSGEPLGRVDCGRVDRPLAREGGNVAAMTAAGSLVLLDAATGAAVGEPIAGVDAAAPFMLAADALLYFDGQSLRRADLAAGETSLMTKVYPKYFGRITGGLLVRDSHVLFAAEKRGLMCLKPKAH